MQTVLLLCLVSVNALWFQSNGSAYYYSNEPANAGNYGYAENACLARSSELVSINTETEHDFLKDADGNKGHYWIGLSCNQNARCTTTELTWEDGSNVTFTNRF